MKYVGKSSATVSQGRAWKISVIVVPQLANARVKNIINVVPQLAKVRLKYGGKSSATVR